MQNCFRAAKGRRLRRRPIWRRSCTRLGERRAFRASCETVDLNALVERTLKGRASNFAAHGIHVHFSAAAGLAPVSVVPGEIEQVLVNLLVNAEQAMHGARGRGELHIVTRSAGQHVEVQVADDGPGIKPEHLPRLFETFFTTKPVGVGSGLGLSIARRIACDHGGDLVAESELGKGATFRLCLPAAGPALMSQEPPPPAGSGSPGRVQTILIVEDEPALLQSVERLLRRRGFEVAAVADVGSALEQLERRMFDVVLCDIHLGDQSGIQLYHAAAHRRPDLRTRFVFVTGDVLRLEVRDFLDSTGARRLTKPFELTELLHEIAQVLRAA